MPRAVNPDLEDWADVEEDGPWPRLLVGNGASMAVWPSFKYSTLFEKADLGDDDLELFDALDGTRNFEVVLDALRVSRLVCDQLEHDADEVDERYEAIKESLIQAVSDIHVPWPSIEPRVLTSIGKALLRHTHIYSTNYDLLIWAPPAWPGRPVQGGRRLGGCVRGTADDRGGQHDQPGAPLSASRGAAGCVPAAR
jgi:hypothetical protein